MKESDKDLLGDSTRRRFFRHTCNASIKGAFEYDRSDKWSRDVRLGYLKSDAVAQNRLPVLNISTGGIALVSRYPVVKDAAILIKISTAFKTEIRATARIRWSKRLKGSTEAFAVGCEFLHISRSDARSLKELLSILEQGSAGHESRLDN